jgi:exodeoxyribonuclease-3
MRGKAFDTDTGWRIDYLLANPELAAKMQDVQINRAASYAERWSDHAPVTTIFGAK